MGMSEYEEEKIGGGSTTAGSVEESKRTQWSERAASKGSSNVHRGVDNTQRSSDFCRV